MGQVFSATNLTHMALAGVYALAGVLIFAFSFWVVDKVTPGSLWKELMENRNTAVGILFGCWAIGLAIIIAAAIHTS